MKNHKIIILTICLVLVLYLGFLNVSLSKLITRNIKEIDYLEEKTIKTKNEINSLDIEKDNLYITLNEKEIEKHNVVKELISKETRKDLLQFDLDKKNKKIIKLKKEIYN